MPLSRAVELVGDELPIPSQDGVRLPVLRSREGDSVEIAVHSGVDVGVARRVGARGQFGAVHDSGARNYAGVGAWLDAARGKLRQGFASAHGNRQASPMTLSRREFDWDI